MYTCGYRRVGRDYEFWETKEYWDGDNSLQEALAAWADFTEPINIFVDATVFDKDASSSREHPGMHLSCMGPVVEDKYFSEVMGQMKKKWRVREQPPSLASCVHALGANIGA